MSEFHRYPSIANLYRALDVLEAGDVVVTEKLHGTNNSVRYVKTPIGYTVRYGSRSHDITDAKESDNYGFTKFANEERLNVKIGVLFETLEDVGFTPLDEVIVHGEFVGHGIQAGVDYVGATRAFFSFGLELGNGNGEYKFVPPLAAFPLLQEVGFLTVPILFAGQADMTKLNQLVGWRSIVACAYERDSVMEGIVIQPQMPQRNRHGNWLLAKLKNEQFAEVEHTPRVVSDDDITARAVAIEFAMTYVTNERVRHARDAARENGETIAGDLSDLEFLARYVLTDIQREAADAYAFALNLCSERVLHFAIGKQVVTALKQVLIQDAVPV